MDGRWLPKWRSETGRLDDPGSDSADAQARPARGSRLRRALQSGPASNPLAPRPSRQGASGPSQIANSDPGEQRAPGQHGPGAAIFWEALDPIQRDAFRSVASLRTFAAGARLIAEGDQADHVIVILSGRTRISVEANGREQILAERGPGQLVGERAVLQISVRSANVIALETVQALVVRTGDFAAFISAHPTVLDIVESQLYDRSVEDPARYRSDDVLTGLRSSLSDEATAADYVRGPLSAGRPAQHPHLLSGENCTVILSDVVGFGARTRTDEDRRVIREALFRMTHTVLRGLLDVWSWDDHGDGLLTVVPPSVPTGKVIEQLHRKLPPALEEHNRTHHDSARIQLRVAVNVGPVASDTVGVSGEAIIITARLVDAPLFKKAMDASRVTVGVIASMFIYETVIRHSPELTGYSEIQVNVKESSISAWMKLFGPD